MNRELNQLSSPTEHASKIPLCVDLDGTLIRTDLLYESTLRLVKTNPLLLLQLPFWLVAGKTVLKRRLTERVGLDVTQLPYNEPFVEWLRENAAHGRRLVLCTASDERYAQAVAEHLGIFSDVIGSDSSRNNSAHHKAQALVARFGRSGFDYAGNSKADLPVWRDARRAILVNTPSPVAAEVRAQGNVDSEFSATGTGPSVWCKALRLRQWLKNLLLFLPLLASHRIAEPELLAQAALAFLAFGLCASSVYLANDLLDLENDRQHPRKRLRPFAAGTLSLAWGAALAPILSLVAFVFAWQVNAKFAMWLGGYFALTTAYTFLLKRIMLLDSLALAGLYTLRIVAGGMAVGVPVSFWLLTFSLFLFLSLAFVKRFTELRVVAGQGGTIAPGRGYQTEDAPLVEMFGIASGFTAALVMAFYINSDAVKRLYADPEWLWLTVPIIVFWVGWIWLRAHRNEMDDDPVMFATRDRLSLAAGALFAVAIWMAI